MFRFASELKKRRLYIQQILTLALLWVFALAITPWSSLHHHEEQTIVVEKHCTHHLHLKTTQETCLICKAHFEKKFMVSKAIAVTYLESKVFHSPKFNITSSYAELISTSLRGPPAYS
ncbi:hypothetical protein [Pedobacter cryotolerans]|uniref:Uncharacterized protein n=1 Tax=Pedobacter cryotolerans TaxID=2571270 RepID=A0A4V5NY45_9SPHI|nr:hypothetical protein [Pedobacter cryotolerans]TKC01977.1 hypothetical protein FA045_06940 [Pedobacter cryotolerans]